MVALVCYICNTDSRSFFVQNLHLLCLFFDLVSVSISRVLWCEPKTIRNQFFVLFRKYNKTIIDDIFKVTTKREREKNKNAAGKS